MARCQRSGFGCAAFPILFLALGCSNFSTLQTARTLAPGKIRAHLGGGAFNSNQLSSVVTSSTSSTSNQSLVFPFVEVAVRAGVARHFEAGAKYTVPGSVALEGKYQFIDGSAFASALGLQIGYLPITVNNQTTQLLDFAFPLYLSVDFADWFGLYASGRYLLRMQLGANSSTTPFYAVGGGIRVGNRVGLLGEVTYVRQPGSSFQGIQFSGALFFGNGASVPGQDDERGDSSPDSTSRRRVSQVFDTVEQGRVLRITHDDARPWRSGEPICVVTAQRVEVACGVVVKTDSVSATVRVQRRKGKVAPGMEVIPRP